MGCLRCMSRVKSFHVKILLLDKQELIQEIQDKTTGQDLLDNIFKYLNLIETAYFGLRYQDNDNQTVISFFPFFLFNSPKPWRVLIPSFSFLSFFLLSSSAFCLLLLLTSFYFDQTFHKSFQLGLAWFSLTQLGSA